MYAHRVKEITVVDGPATSYASSPLGLLLASARFLTEHSVGMDVLMFVVENKDGSTGNVIIRERQGVLELEITRAQKHT